MSGTTTRRQNRTIRPRVALSVKHEMERAHFQDKAEDRDYRARRNEYDGLKRSTDGRKRLVRLSAHRVQLGVIQRRRITVRHMLHGDMGD